jgi:hypothetical protein
LKEGNHETGPAGLADQGSAVIKLTRGPCKNIHTAGIIPEMAFSCKANRTGLGKFYLVGSEIKGHGIFHALSCWFSVQTIP